MGTLGMSFGGDTNASTDHRSTIYTMDAPAGKDKVRLNCGFGTVRAFGAATTQNCEAVSMRAHI